MNQESEWDRVLTLLSKRFFENKRRDGTDERGTGKDLK
jgi:hypothetical protein